VIAIMGATGAGKSTFISLLSEESIEIGHGLDSRSLPISCLPVFFWLICDIETADVKIHSFRHSGDRIGYLIDTPGFDDTTRSDSEVLNEIAYFLANLYYKSKKLSGLIYLHRIIDPKMGGSAVKNLNIFQKMCGQGAFPSIMLVSTMWEELRPENGGTSVGERREAELRSNDRFWGTMVKRGSRVARHNGTSGSAQAILSQMVDQKKVVLEIQRQMVDHNFPLVKTVAGEFLDQEFTEARKQQEEELRELKENMEAAKKEKDQEMVELLLAQQKTCEGRLQATDSDQRKLKVDFKALEQEQSPRYQALIEQLKRENAMEGTVGANASDIKFLEQSLADLQDDFERKEKEHRAQVSRLLREVKAQSVQEQQRIYQMIADRDRLWQDESMRMMAQIKAEGRREDRQKTSRMAIAASGASNLILDLFAVLFPRRRAVGD
jgi:hypothetical protein